MAKRRRYTAGTKKKLPCLIFSFDQLQFLKQTLIALELVIHKQNRPLPNLNFALHTVIELQAKISTMLNSEMWEEVVEMDANELLMLQTSIWIFTAALDTLPDIHEKERLKKQCETIGFFLAPFSQQVFHQN